jgi:hypothetical protein
MPIESLSGVTVLSLWSIQTQGSQRHRATKRSTGALAIATRTGAYEASKRLPRWRGRTRRPEDSTSTGGRTAMGSVMSRGFAV